MIELDVQLQDQINAAATRYYWAARLHSGRHWVPTRRLMSIAQEAIAAFHDAGLNRELPRTEMASFVDAAEAWLVRNQGKIWKLARLERRAENAERTTKQIG